MTRQACRVCMVPRQRRMEGPATGANTTPLGARTAWQQPPTQQPHPQQQPAAPDASQTHAPPPAAPAATGEQGRREDGPTVHFDSAASRTADVKRLARLDMALDTLDTDEDKAAKEALQEARTRCAARITASQPLGKRLRAAQAALKQAALELARAETAARTAAAAAEAALGKEHKLRALVEQLEGEATLVRGATTDASAEQVRAYMSSLDTWLGGMGLEPPPDVRATACALREAISEPAGPATPETVAESDSEDEGMGMPAGDPSSREEASTRHNPASSTSYTIALPGSAARARPSTEEPPATRARVAAA